MDDVVPHGRTQGSTSGSFDTKYKLLLFFFREKEKPKTSSITWQSIFTSTLLPPFLWNFKVNLSCLSHSGEIVPLESNKFYNSPTRRKKNEIKNKNKTQPKLISCPLTSYTSPVFCNKFSAFLHSQISWKVFLHKLSPLSTFPIYSSAKAAWHPPPSLIRNGCCQS